MPTPKFSRGAQLIPLSFANPAFQGLNTELGGNILPQQWATILENAVFDDTGRPASRKGWNTLTTTPGATNVKTLFEHWEADETSTIIQASDTDIYEDVSTPSSIKGSLTISDGNIKFVNFNDKCVAFGIGTGGIPAVRTTGNFADITVNSGTAPTSGVGTSAFGRLWCVDTDGKTMRYSALLDETRWDSADGGGSVDFSKVWPSGQDSVVAIEEFGADLIVFGKNNTVIMTDGSGSTLGIDPTALYVSDTIPGVGAISQFAITRAAGDLWVLTDFGIVGLKRELVQKSTPYNNISTNVQSGVTGALAAQGTAVDDIRMAFSPKHSMVVAHFPAVDTSYVFDTRFQMENGAYRCSTWLSSLQALTYVRAADNFYGTLSGATGEVFSYTGNSDNGTAFVFDYESGWLDLGEELNLLLKFVKRMTSFVFITQNVEVTHKVQYDFQNNEFSINKSAQGTPASEYNAFGAVVSGSTQAEYAADGDAESVEYGGGVTLVTLDAPLGGSGQYIKVGLRLSTEAGEFVLQQINLFAKVGRYAT